jgi:hypothetical protein
MFEIGAERYAWLNKILAVGVGERLPPKYGSVLDIRDTVTDANGPLFGEGDGFRYCPARL